MTARAGGAVGVAGADGSPRDVVVGVAELRLSATPGERLVTYALGSCLGIAIYDPVARVAGLLHAMLPTAAVDPERGRRTPAMFVDAGVPLLFRESYRLGARKERIVVRVAGGMAAGRDEEADQFRIGQRNVLALRRLLSKNGVRLHAHDVGGVRTSRTVSLDVATGVLAVRSGGRVTHL